MKKIIFKWSRGWNDVIEEIAEYDYDVTEEEINEDFQQWVWEKVMDNFTWYEKQ